MNTTVTQIIELIQGYGDSLVPMDTIKEAIALLETADGDHKTEIALLRGQIGICSSDDTQFFSRQLSADKLVSALKAN